MSNDKVRAAKKVLVASLVALGALARRSGMTDTEYVEFRVRCAAVTAAANAMMAAKRNDDAATKESAK